MLTTTISNRDAERRRRVLVGDVDAVRQPGAAHPPPAPGAARLAAAGLRVATDGRPPRRLGSTSQHPARPAAAAGAEPFGETRFLLGGLAHSFVRLPRRTAPSPPSGSPCTLSANTT